MVIMGMISFSIPEWIFAAVPRRQSGAAYFEKLKTKVRGGMEKSRDGRRRWGVECQLWEGGLGREDTKQNRLWTRPEDQKKKMLQRMERV